MRVGSLEIQLIAGIARLQKDMNDAQRIVGGAMGNVEKSVASANRAMQALGVRLSVLAIVDQVRRMTDQYAKLDAQLRLSTKSQAQYAQGMNDIRRISAVAQSDLSTTSMLYTRLMNVMDGTGVSQAKLATVTETVSFGLKAYGATAQEASSAALQLSQAMGANRLGGEEFRAVMEAMPNVMKVVAQSMGVPLGALRQLSIDGKITADVLVKALGDPAIAAQFKAMAENTQTVTGAWTVARNELMLLVGEFGKSSGGVNLFIGGFNAMADAFRIVAQYMQRLIFIAGGYVTFLATKLIVTTALAIEKNIAHTEALAMNAAMTLRASQQAAALAAAKAGTAAATAASTVSMLRNTIATVEANTATAAKAAADNTAAIAQLNHARAAGVLSGHLYIVRQVEAELVVTTQALAVAQTELAASTARQARLQAALIVEDKAAVLARADLVKANAAVVVSQNAATASTIGNIAAIGVALRTAAMAHPITAAALAIGTIIVAIANWKDIVDGSKSSLNWFMSDFIGGLQFLAAGVGISLGELVQKMSLLANLTWPDLKSGEFKKQWDELGKLAEQSRIEAAARIAGIDKQSVDREKLVAAERYAADRGAWDKLHQTKAQHRAAEIAELDAQYQKLASQQGIGQDAQLKLYGEYLVKRKEIENSQQAGVAKITEETKLFREALLTAAQASGASAGALAEYEALLKKMPASATPAIAVSQQIIDSANSEKYARLALAKAEEDYANGLASNITAELKSLQQMRDRNDLMTLGVVGVEEMMVAEARLAAQRASNPQEVANANALLRIAEEKLVEAQRQQGLKDYYALLKESEKADADAKAQAVADDLKVANEKWRKIDGFARNAFDNITMKGKNAFAEIGQAIKSSILDMLYRMTVQKWMINVGLVGGSSTANAAGMSDGGGIGTAGSVLSAVGNIGASVSAFGSSVLMGAESAVGFASAASSTATAMSAAGQTASTFGLQLGAAMPYIAAAYIAYRLLTQDHGTPTTNLGQAGTSFDAAGNPTRYSTGVNNSVTAATDSMINGLQTSYMQAAMQLGIGAVTTQFNYGANTGKDGKAPNFALGGGAGGVNFYQGETLTSDAAIQLAASRAVFSALQGSNLPQYLARMFDDLSAGAMTQQQITDTLAFAGSVKQMRDALLETRAPLEVMRANVTATNAALRTTAETFRTDFVAAIDAGINPATFAQWQQLGTAIDQLAAADAQAAATTLQKITDTLKTVRDAMSRNVSSAFAVLTAAVDRERKTITEAYTASVTAVRTQIDRITTSVGNLRDLSSALGATLQAMGVGMTRGAGQAALVAALSIATSGGALPSAASLKPALDAIAKPSEGLFTNFIDYQRDFQRTANNISALNLIADTQLTSAEQQVLLLHDQLSVMEAANNASMLRLDDIVANTKLQVDAINETTVATKSVADAMVGLYTALGAQQAAAAVNTPTVAPPTYSNAEVAAYVNANIANPIDIYLAAAQNGVSLARIDESMGWAAGTSSGWAASQGLPSFATGINAGILPADTLLQAHGGERITPAAYVDTERGAREETNALLARLLDENRVMRNELTSIKTTNYKMWQIDDKHDNEGMPDVRAA